MVKLLTIPGFLEISQLQGFPGFLEISQLQGFPGFFLCLNCQILELVNHI